MRWRKKRRYYFWGENEGVHYTEIFEKDLVQT